MGIRLTVLWIWKVLDPIFFICSRLHYIHPAASKNSIFRVRVTKYKGKMMVLADGTKISKNDLLLKIHLHNVRLLMELINTKNELSRTRQIYKTVLFSMPPLARYLKIHPLEKNIKGIIGVTTINKGVGQLGFESFSPSNSFYKYFKKMGQFPITFLSCASIKSFQRHNLSYLIMSKENLYSRYLKEMSSTNLELFTKHNQALNAKN